ncbi:heme-binding protein [Motiliproteus sp. SC1-56]|uniref:GlcG/HbpS family heme-binding protein n=1 Tax=Motiliproteus sp. SC1-56 TaxID=2799565 RepID=UPI001A8FED2E|nr:heme-binding protein [Motiliproteus sp. SC1-56]
MPSRPLPFLLLGGLFSGLFSALASAQPLTLPTQKVLPLEVATALAQHAIAACAEAGYAVSATVVDTSGVVRAQLRGDGAGPHTLESSRKKAYTAVSLGESTENLSQLVTRMPAAAGLRDMGTDILVLGGGLPLRVAQDKVGGIGVGGAPGGHLDQGCAQAAIDQVLSD